MAFFPRLLTSLALVAAGSTSALAGSEPTVSYSGGVAIGIQDLLVDGVNYDVSFVTGSYNSLFAATPPAFLGKAAVAGEAGLALRDFMNSQPATLIGTSGTCCGLLFIPYADTFLDMNGLPGTPPSGQPQDWFKSVDIAYQDGTGETWARYGDSLALKAIDVSDYNNYDWLVAVFTADVQQNQVPEPDGLLLACTSLASLAWMMRRRGRRLTLSKMS